MSYNIKLHPQAHKFLEKQQETLAQRIRKKLLSIKDNPHLFLEPITNHDVYKLRIGDYRALIEIDEHTLYVQYINHRKRVYKRMNNR